VKIIPLQNTISSFVDSTMVPVLFLHKTATTTCYARYKCC